MKTTLTIDVTELGMTIQDINQIKQIFEQYKGKKIDVTIEKHKRKRSNPQNAYLHGVVIPMVTQGINEHGNTITQLQTKDLLKSMFLSIDTPISDDGEYVTITQNTSGLDTTAFNEFIEKVQQWSAEMLGIIIPEPNESLTFQN
jgi:hypothetical protein